MAKLTCKHGFPSINYYQLENITNIRKYLIYTANEGMKGLGTNIFGNVRAQYEKHFQILPKYIFKRLQ